ncbi:class E sortase [Streptomyces zhihengii]|uniref:class E sortase n=1 Tax=Streptomyces zhihengii TaxID=1818004 RepID=UPI00369A9DE2
MSAGRPGHEETGGYGGEGYDPLTDPLPQSGHGSPWFRTPSGDPADDEPAPEPYGRQTPPQAYGAPPQQEPYDWYDREGYRQDWYGPDGAGGPEAPPAPASGHPRDPQVPRARHAAPAPEQHSPATVSGAGLAGPFAEPGTGAAAPFTDPGAQAARPFTEPGDGAAGSFTEPGAGAAAPFTEPGAQDVRPFTEPGPGTAGSFHDAGRHAAGPEAGPERGALRVPDPAPDPSSRPTPAPDPGPVPDDETVALRTSETRRAAEVPPGPGRAERRRAAKGRGHRRGAAAPAPAEQSGETAAEPAKPMSRMEARRAAKAAKDSPAVIASRAIGELFITFGVLMLLFVTYQLWWTNVLAGQQADRAASRIQDDWAKGRKPDAFEPGQGFALMYIPKLDVVVPIAEGIDKHKVLDRGMVGHYAEGKLKTAMPEDEQGNFAVAGHRNTHGEPFRYINRLEPGDPIVVETQDTYYTYEMASILPQTVPSNVAVIDPVPRGSGFTKPGRYITLTTCTPEFTSTYRMIVWGKMVEERPRSQGKPDALVG